MANIGINASPEYIGATKSNTWHIPTNENGDIFPVMEEYFKNPLKPNSPIPAFITFPSVKDISYNEQEKNKTSCQMLLMAEYDWFKQYLPEIVQEKLNNNQYHTYDHNDRDKENYEKLKEIWKERVVEIFLHYFPKVSEKLCTICLYCYSHIVHFNALPCLLSSCDIGQRSSCCGRYFYSIKH